MFTKNKRSMLHFGVLIVFMVTVSLFVMKKANEAIAEIDALDSPIYLK